MTPMGLDARIQTRDRLVFETAQVGQSLRQRALAALDAGDLDGLRRLLDDHDTQLLQLVENLRIYQAELRAQADELASGQARTESALARFATLFASMPVAVLLVAADGQVMEHNTLATELFMLRAHGGPHRFLHRLVVDADYQAQVWPALAQRRPARLEPVRFLTESGRRFSGELHVAPLPALAGQGPAMACAVIDRTEQLQQLQALNDAHAALDTHRALLAESARLAHMGGFEWRQLPRSWHASPELCNLLAWQGPTPPTLADTLALCQDDGAERLRTALERALHENQSFQIELHMQAMDGSVLQVLAIGHRERQANGQLHVVGLMQDIGPQAQALAAREAAEAASRSKTAFLSRMSHELRTPLNAVVGFTQLMRMDYARGDAQVKPQRLEMMEQAARHLLDLVNEVLDVSRLESGQVQLTLEPVALAEVADDCVALMQGLAEQARVNLLWPPDAPDAPARGSLHVSADRLRLKEVLINLIANAIKYNRPGGRVELRLTADATEVHLAVTDTGCGMDPALLDQLFQPFNRLGADRTRIEGSGLGLYVAHRFVTLMNGRIDVSSQPGTGSTFVLSLPRDVR